MKFEKWTVAWRNREGEKTLLDNMGAPFHTIPNSWRYWASDPHLIDCGGKTWIFAELYDRVLRRGVIGCCELTGQGATPWQVVLDAKHHLSYPHLLCKDGSVYMIPESYVANEIAVYRAAEFPVRWEKVRVLKDDFCAVDSTVFEANGTKWMMTLRFTDEKEQLMLFPVGAHGLQDDGVILSENDPNKRPGGNFFSASERLIRPAQDCSGSYGCALNLYEVTEVSEHKYQETLLTKITPADVTTDLGCAAAGLHTYNFNGNYEVIDLKEYEFDWLFYIMRPIWFIWRRVRKVLG